MKIADLFDCFLIDMDGVIYVDDLPTEGSVETINCLKKDGKLITFVTNNPRRTAQEYAEKLRIMGVETEPGDILTSAMAIAFHLKSEFSELGDKRAYVIGSRALKDEITLTGLKIVDGEEAKTADFVILGSHPEFHYNEMKLATIAIRRGALFYATNRDPAYPSSEGLIPATGAMIAAIEAASGKTAVVAGKPEVIMFEVALTENLHKGKHRMAIIGDCLDTDIAGGKKAGIATILTLTGTTKEEDLAGSDIKPDYVIRNLTDLFKDIEATGKADAQG